MSSYNVKEMMSKKERLAPGHRMCAGCGATIGVRAVLRALHEEDHAVIANATGCLEVSSFMYPYSAWEDSYIHNAFENAGATLSGVETAYKALKNVENFQKTKTLNSSHLVEMVELMISDSSLYQELWNVVMTWFMCVTITELI
ncbi:porB protein [Lachnospiraceae bacterium 5_1_63FAA]|nr:porB protein [Lachnospiraceae bacterium 5_1_63FAA]